MRHSPMVGELVAHFLQDVDIEVLLVQDPPRNWLLQPALAISMFFTR